MIVVDTSAWVEHFRGRSHPVAARSQALARVRSQLVALPILRFEGLADYEEAALIYRTCRAAGQPIRDRIDCLIAVPTIRHGASLLHSDRDFEAIARHTSLKVVV